MDRKAGDIDVDDVYDLAAQIGDDFQKIIDTSGSDVVKSLMPRVIRVLEHLEVLSIRKDDIESELDSLKLNVYQLEHDKREKAHHMNQYELEMEVIDDNWRQENLHLTECLNELRNKNIKLTNSLIDKENTLSQSLTDLQLKGQMEIDSEINSLKESIKRSDSKVESLTKEIDLKNEQIDKLCEQVEAVIRQNGDLRKRIKTNKTQIKYISQIKDTLAESLQPTVQANNYDNNDSDSPIDQSDQQIFSLIQIRNVYLERNSLKARVFELEEEIKRLKALYNLNDTNNSTDNSFDDESEDLPVQGPINREPDDKLFPGKQQNKILRFFPILSWHRIKRP